MDPAFELLAIRQTLPLPEIDLTVAHGHRYIGFPGQIGVDEPL
jgi:hypothetical protein